MSLIPDSFLGLLCHLVALHLPIFSSWDSCHFWMPLSLVLSFLLSIQLPLWLFLNPLMWILLFICWCLARVLSMMLWLWYAFPL